MSGWEVWVCRIAITGFYLLLPVIVYRVIKEEKSETSNHQSSKHA